MSDFWFCVKHHRVEQGEGVCPPIDRLGPYPAREEAEHALEKAAERNEEWETDPRYHDPDEEKDDDETGWGPFRT